MKTMKKVLNTTRKAIVISITMLACLFIIAWGTSLDSQTFDQILYGGIISCLCGIWLCIFLYANCEEEE